MRVSENSQLGAKVLFNSRETQFGTNSQRSGPVTFSKDVAGAVYFAATDASLPMMSPAGEDANQAEAARTTEKR